MTTLGPFELGPETRHPAHGIYYGDARRLAEYVPDESVDLIFTDPVYDRIDDYRWLAETAARVLRPGGAVLVWTFNSEFDAVLDAMRPALTYRYTLHWQRYGPIYHGIDRLLAVITQCVWLDRDGGSTLRKSMADWTGAAQGGLRDNSHKWSKPLSVITKWLDAFSWPGDLILDPFSGGGTVPVACKQLNRRYLAFEHDLDTVIAARERVRNAQPPLLVPQAEQLGLEITA